MDVFVKVKALGRKKDILSPTPYTLPAGIGTLRQLLTAVVQKEVACYNSKEAEAQLIPYLTREELDAQAKAGKVGFGAVYSSKKADPQKSLANALQCWEDGLVRVFMGEDELTDLDAPLSIREGAVFTFIRLTFLTGSLW